MHADLLSLIMALEVPDVVAITTIHVVPDQSDYTANFSLLRSLAGVPSGANEATTAGFEIECKSEILHRLSGQVPMLAQLLALHDSGLLGDLDVKPRGPVQAADWDRRGEYIVKTRIGRLIERAVLLRNRAAPA